MLTTIVICLLFPYLSIFWDKSRIHLIDFVARITLAKVRKVRISEIWIRGSFWGAPSKKENKIKSDQKIKLNLKKYLFSLWGWAEITHLKGLTSSGGSATLGDTC